MSYSNLNDAFSSNFENNNIRELSLNIPQSHEANNNSYYDEIFRIKQPSETNNKKSLYSENESLNGTDLNNNKIKNKLTHRECIKIYNNPNHNKNNDLTTAFTHISKCNLCKEEIKKNIVKNNLDEKIKNDLASSFSDNLSELSITRNVNNSDTKKQKILQSDDIDFLQNNFKNNQIKNSNNLINPVIQNELKLINDKIQEDNNLKYQNAVLQTNISKYLEDIEEKKKINNKIDKILELINYNISQTAKLTNNFSFKEYNNKNLIDLFQNQNSVNNPTNYPNNNYDSGTNYLLYTGIFLIIILLLVDIILRIISKNQ